MPGTRTQGQPTRIACAVRASQTALSLRQEFAVENRGREGMATWASHVYLRSATPYRRSPTGGANEAWS